MPTSPSFEEQIRAYNEELRRYYAQSHPAPREEPSAPAPAAEPPTEPEPVAAEPSSDIESPPASPVERPWESAKVEAWMEQILRSAEQSTDPWDSVESFMAETPSPEPDSPDAPDDVGFLQVRVFSARGAVPLVGATVSVIGHDPAGQETLLHMDRTDQSGIAPQVSLPTPDRALSYRPGDATPFFTYVVQVNAPGYVTVRNEGVSVYGGVTSLQGVPMIPLPEPQIDYENEVVVRPGGAPPELN